jgi:hypothetical protein
VNGPKVSGVEPELAIISKLELTEELLGHLHHFMLTLIM